MKETLDCCWPTFGERGSLPSEVVGEKTEPGRHEVPACPFTEPDGLAFSIWNCPLLEVQDMAPSDRDLGRSSFYLTDCWPGPHAHRPKVLVAVAVGAVSPPEIVRHEARWLLSCHHADDDMAVTMGDLSHFQ